MLFSICQSSCGGVCLGVCALAESTTRAPFEDPRDTYETVFWT